MNGKLHKLPDPGGYVSADGSKACPECGSSVFLVVECERESIDRDTGQLRRWTTVDVQCPKCELLTARNVVGGRHLGHYDVATGRLEVGP